VTLVVRTGSLKSSAKRRDDALDVTRGTGQGLGLTFAPSARLFLWIKEEAYRGRLRDAWSTFEQKYRTEMTLSREIHPQDWTSLLDRRSVTILCYCDGAGVMCHRSILAKILVELGAVYDGEIE
jgi:uncharacterized protein YeaO (DUF488 family)